MLGIKFSLGYKTTVQEKEQFHSFMQCSFDFVQILSKLYKSAQEQNLALASLQCCGMLFSSVICTHNSCSMDEKEVTSDVIFKCGLQFHSTYACLLYNMFHFLSFHY